MNSIIFKKQILLFSCIIDNSTKLWSTLPPDKYVNKIQYNL